tara:strand:- start:837 stop:1031 length:195 start_codon:yes stop_codon:yes gene_type:complete
LTTYLNTEAEQFHAALALAEELPRDYRIQLAVCLMAFELSPADVKALSLRLLKLYTQLMQENKE